MDTTTQCRCCGMEPPTKMGKGRCWECVRLVCPTDSTVANYCARADWPARESAR